MSTRWRWAILGGGVGLYLIGLGFLGGAEASEDPWAVHVRRVDEALAKQDFYGAERAWREVYVLALRSQRWGRLVEAGDLHLRMGEVTGARKAAEQQARRVYLRAIVRARAERSVDGVLRAAEAFDKLGDREVAERSFRMAEQLAGRRVGVRPVSLRSVGALSAP